MSEFAGFDLDRSSARAWSRFRARLADHLAEMKDDDILVVTAESSVDEDEVDGSAPYVQFCAFGEDWVRCEVSSNQYLAAEHRLDPGGVEALQELGWSPPTCDRDAEASGHGAANFYLDLERRQADRVAMMTVHAFRDVFGVAHPAFLASDNLGSDDVVSNLGVPTSRSPSDADPAEPLAVVPSDRAHLQSLVDDALTPFFGHVPEHDEDGDIPVVSGSALLFVRVLEGVPAIQIFAFLVHDVSDLGRAAFEVSVLNRDNRFIRFVLVEDRVMAYLELPAWPFAPQHLRTMLALMAETLDHADEDLVARVGGGGAFEPAPEEDTFEGEDLGDAATDVEEPGQHPAMMTLLQLDAESEGSVDPALAASICGMDRDLILRLITWNSGEEVEWRRARDQSVLDGDPDDEADVCDHEMRHAERMTNLLRRALRVLVERELGREPGTASYGEAPRRRTARKSPSRSRRKPDPSLEEVDPEIWS